MHPAGDPAAAPRRGARRCRQRQDGAGAAAGQGAHPRARRRAAGASGWRCCATRSVWPSTSSARSRAGPASTGRRSSAPSRSSAGSGARPRATATDSEFWEERLPRLMAELAAELPDGKKYDSVVVDEAQDFADTWWEPVLGALRDEERGRRVRLLRREPADLRPVRPPAGAAGAAGARPQPAQHQADPRVASARSRRAGCTPAAATGPAVRFVAATPTEALGRRRRRGRGPARRRVGPGQRLPADHRSPPPRAAGADRAHGHRSATGAPSGRARTSSTATCSGCKGLERAAVVLCVNEAGERDRARERLYVGMSRATDVLVVVGDPEVVRRVGGDEVARRLGIDG